MWRGEGGGGDDGLEGNVEHCLDGRQGGKWVGAGVGCERRYVRGYEP